MTLVGAYAFSLLIGSMSAVFLGVMTAIPRWSVFVSTLTLWIIILAIADWRHRVRGQREWPHTVLTATTLVAFVGLSSLMEWQLLRWFLAGLAGIAMGVLHLDIASVVASPVGQKIFRRVVSMLWVFNGYALMTTFFAFPFFFPHIPFWLLTIVMGLIGGAIAFFIWRMYLGVEFRHTIVWAGVLSLLTIEYVWVVGLMPFGYLVSGFLVMWVWYLLQLLIRFHLTPQGILWQKQWKFLAMNAVLYILFLWFVRWV